MVGEGGEGRHGGGGGGGNTAGRATVQGTKRA